MALQFPTSPTLNQIHQDAGIVYQWNGTKWKRMDIYQFPSVLEYTDIVEQTSANVDIQPDKYNYYKINVDVPVTIEMPNASPYTSLVMELNSGIPTTYDLTNGSYDNVSFSVTSQESIATCIFLKPDGTKFYIAGYFNDSVHQYTLSTAWDLSTASYDSVSFSVVSQDGTPIDIQFKSDGIKMYMLGFGNDRVYQYTLSTAWDLSTASYDSVSFSVASQQVNPLGLFLKSDGTKMYITGSSTVYQYTLSTAWDLSSASYDSINFSFTSQESQSRDIFFKPDGAKMFMVGSGSDLIYQYTLSTPWDVSTASYDSVSFSVASQDDVPFDLFFKPDGTKMYIVGSANDTVYQYNTSATAIQATWSDNILWASGSAPAFDNTYDKTVLLHFVTYDGVNWVAQQLSLDSRSS
jgi:hypothetical protein